jgi:hypothetical protein
LSSFALSRSSGPWLYTVAGIVALFELGVAWQALYPDVSANYRAYYLDQSTTCLDEPVSGAYAFGTELTFRSGFEKLDASVKDCGWEGPVGDGLHAVGESSRLRFALPADARNLTLMLEMVAVDFAGKNGQAVSVLVNGSALGNIRPVPGTPQRFNFSVPDSVLTHSHLLDVELRFPEAIQVGPEDPNTRKRSIKLSAAKVS